MKQAIVSYLERGWPVIALKPREKVPQTSHGLKDATTNENTIAQWWERWPNANVGLATGKNAGFWVLDIDGAQGAASLAQLESENGPLPTTLEQWTGSGGRHLCFAWPAGSEVRNRQSFRSGLDVRGEGGYIVAPPSIHPSGKRYTWVDENTAIIEAPTWLLEMIIPERHRVSPPWEKAQQQSKSVSLPQSTGTIATPITERASMYLRECDPAIQGMGGHDSLLWAARAMVIGFELDSGTALRLLETEYNPRCSPPWDLSKPADAKDFRRKVAEAKRTPGQKPSGWLLDECGLRDIVPEAGRKSAAALLAGAKKLDTSPEPTKPKLEKPEGQATKANPAWLEKAAIPRTDPGPFPPRLLSIPGFVNSLKAVSMAGAPYPNETAAFAGALVMLSLLTARKIRTSGDARTNLYILLLAPSGNGKDYPRKVNGNLLHKLGLIGSLGDSFASAEGIEDALYTTQAMLYQLDEMSEYLASVAADKEGRWRRIQSILLRLFSTSNSVFVLRKKAGQEGGGYIDQPSLTLFGTAVPSVCAAAISKPMLTGGFLGRCLLMEAGRRGKHQDPLIIEIPDNLLEIASYWRDYWPGGDLGMVTPQPATVPATKEAEQLFAEFAGFVDGQYAEAEATGDEISMAIWSRPLEHIQKLSLLYAASESHKNPVISKTAIEWACEFILHHTRRLLWFSRTCLADSPFEKDCQRILGILRRAGARMSRSQLLKRSKMKAREFDGVVRTLIETGQIESCLDESNGGRPGVSYAIGQDG
jgi:hypothetical protein